MIRDHLIHLRCPKCLGPFRIYKARSRGGFLSSGKLLCRTCGFIGSIQARVPIILSPGKSAVGRLPFQRTAGYDKRTKEQRWDELIDNVLEMDTLKMQSTVDMLPDSVFRRAVFRSSDYYYYNFFQSDRTDQPVELDNINLLISNIVKAAPHRLLEIGAGSGELIFRLMKWRPSVTLTVCVDIDFESIKFLEGQVRRGNAIKQTIPLTADACRLPFPTNHFDAIISNNGLAHVEGIGEAVSEINRVLRPNGSIWMIEPLSGSNLDAPDKLGDLMLHMVRNHFKMHHGKDDLIARLKKQQFNIVQQKIIQSELSRSVFIHCRKL